MKYECEYLDEPKCKFNGIKFIKVKLKEIDKETLEMYPICEGCLPRALSRSWNFIASEKEYLRYLKTQILK